MGRIYQQVRGRPRFRVRRVYGLRAGARAEPTRPAKLARSGPMTRIAVFAYSDTGMSCLKCLLERGENVVLVVTHADAPAETAWFPSVAELARTRGIEPVLVDDPTDPALAARVRAAAPELALLLLLPPHAARRTILAAAARSGAFNLHGSLLPRYRGRAPVNWAVAPRRDRDGGDAPRHDANARTRATSWTRRRFRSGRTTRRSRSRSASPRPGVRILERRLEELEGGHRAAPPAGRAQAATTFPPAARPRTGGSTGRARREEVHDLVRAVTHPYPGAFTDVFGGKTFIWKTRLPHLGAHDNFPGPGAPRAGASLRRLRRRPVRRGPPLQREGGTRSTRRHFLLEVGVPDEGPDPRRQRLHRQRPDRAHPRHDRLAASRASTSRSDKIAPFLGHPRFTYLEGDIAINKEWIEYQVKKCDVVLPLVAIATPTAYVKHPLAGLRARLRGEPPHRQAGRALPASASCSRRPPRSTGCARTRSSTRRRSPLVYGPIQKQRWIYSCSKQLLDRVIWAYGESEGLRFTLFRPFNWIGPHLDDVDSPKEGSSRVLTQFLHNILYGEPIKLVDGGTQRRSFTYISDGIDCLMKILENRGRRAPTEASSTSAIPATTSPCGSSPRSSSPPSRRIRASPSARARPPLVEVSSGDYYGEGYQDILTRVPSIRRARTLLGWEPKVGLDEALRLTVDFYLSKSGRGIRIDIGE